MLPDKETLTIEFKSDIKKLSDSEIFEAVVAFANTEGGEALRNWILSWPLAAKIAVPSAIGAAIIIGIVLTIRYAIKNKEKLKKEDSDNEEE